MSDAAPAGRFNHQPPPMTDHWAEIARLHDELAAHAQQERVSGEVRQGIFARVPGVRGTYWDGRTNAPAEAEGSGFLGGLLTDWPIWHGVKLPGVRIGRVQNVDSANATGPVMGVFGNDRPEQAGQGAVGEEEETMSYTTRRLWYITFGIGRFAVGRAWTQDKLHSSSLSGEELSTAQRTKEQFARFKSKFTGHRSASRRDHAELKTVMTHGVRSKSTPPEGHPEA